MGVIQNVKFRASQPAPSWAHQTLNQRIVTVLVYPLTYIFMLALIAGLAVFVVFCFSYVKGTVM